MQTKPFWRFFFGPVGKAAAFCAGLAVVLLVLAASESRMARHLATDGATRNGIVVALAEQHSRVPGQKRRRDSYQVTYTFRLGTTDYTATADVSRRFYDSLSKGSMVAVRYWTKDPTQSEIGPQTATDGVWVYLIAAAFPAAAALFLGRLAWTGAADTLWMARNATLRNVEITDHVESRAKSNGRTLWRAAWRDADGGVGVSSPMHRAALPGLGRTVIILVDPTGRRASRLETDVLA